MVKGTGEWKGITRADHDWEHAMISKILLSGWKTLDTPKQILDYRPIERRRHWWPL